MRINQTLFFPVVITHSYNTKAAFPLEKKLSSVHFYLPF